MVRVGPVIALATVLCPSLSSAQGLFDMFFGPRSESLPTVRYAAREVGRVTRHAPRSEVQIPSLEELSGPQVRRYEPARPGPYVPPPTLPGHLGPFLRDPTLRAGDVVATEKGLMVYRGAGGSMHSESHFLPVTAAKKLVGDKLPLLTRMDRQLKKRHVVIVEDVPLRASTLVASNRPAASTCRPGFVCADPGRGSGGRSVLP